MSSSCMSARKQGAIEATNVDVVVEADVMISDGFRAARQQETGVKDVAGFGAAHEGIDLERSEPVRPGGCGYRPSQECPPHHSPTYSPSTRTRRRALSGLRSRPRMPSPM